LLAGKDEERVQKMRDLLRQAGTEGVFSNWKFSLLANVLSLALLPVDRSNSTKLLQHFFDVSVCSLPLMRVIGMQGIFALLKPVTLAPDAQSTQLAQTVLVLGISSLDRLAFR